MKLRFSNVRNGCSTVAVELLTSTEVGDSGRSTPWGSRGGTAAAARPGKDWEASFGRKKKPEEKLKTTDPWA